MTIVRHPRLPRTRDVSASDVDRWRAQGWICDDLPEPTSEPDPDPKPKRSRRAPSIKKEN